MKYIIRLNQKSINPLTGRVIVERLWEIEQCADRDSEKVVWHCADVRIDSTPIRELFKRPEPGADPWELVLHGICVRGQDNAIEIHTGKQDVSGH